MTDAREMVITVTSKVMGSELARETEAVREVLTDALTAITGGRGDIPAIDVKVDTYPMWTKEMGNQYESRILARSVLRV